MIHKKLGGLVSGLAFAAAPMVIAASAGAQCTGFNVTQSSGASIVAGTVDIGNHGDDVVTTVALPFPVTLYGANYTTVNASSNGNLQFTTANNAYTNDCLPQASTLGVAICPHWDDMRTDGAGEGIFTSISGSSPNRIFNIEWRSHYYSAAGTASFEVRLYEDGSKVEMIYGAVTQGGVGATVGIEHTTYPSSQFFCNTGGLTSGQKVTFTCTNGPLAPSGTGAANPFSVYACGAGGSTVLTVTVTGGFNPPSTGLAVSGDLSSINGSSNQAFYNDGTHGDVTAGDSIWTFTAPVTASVAPGNKGFPITITDAQSRTGTTTIGLLVNPCPSAGPDVYVQGLTDVANYGAVGTITAFAVGTNACNLGDVPVAWYGGTTRHPVIAQNMFRYNNGRLEQLGQSWLKYGFSSTNGGCPSCTQPPDGGQQLGVGCSDAYGSGLNGGQSGLGPRSATNPTTGAFPASHVGGDQSTAIGNRLQVYTSDITPGGANTGARYFVEGHYITADDATWSNNSQPAANGLNNATYQEILNVTNATPSLTGTVYMRTPGIQAWKNIDSAVTMVNADYLDFSLGTVPAGIVARHIIAGKATNNGNGTWHYEFAVANHNAAIPGGSFSVPIGPGVVVTNVGFHGVFTHSGEPYPNTATHIDNWAGVVGGGKVKWSVPEAYTGNGDSGNAIRWGTMYNFRFDANVAPATGAVTLGLYKSGPAVNLTGAGMQVPGAGPCIADVDDGSGTGRPDGGVTIDDLLYYLALFTAGDPLADVDDGSGTGTHDGGVTIDDLLYYLTRFALGC